MTLRILTLSTLFPDASRPNFGVFVERQTRELASRAGVELTVVSPIGIPPWPLSRVAHYRALAAQPAAEQWHGLTVYRPTFPIIPMLGARFHPASIVRAILPLVRRLHAKRPFDVIDASFFYPDGPAAMRIAAALDIPFSIKARGADIHHWGTQPGCQSQIIAAARAASGLLAVSSAMREDMAALGMQRDKIRVHYTGVDLDCFRPAPCRAAAKAALGITGPLLISAGALIPRKSQDLLIRALPDLPDATLLFAGSGPSLHHYQSLALSCGVADRVRFLGSVPHADLPALLAAADVMALPSASEGLANVWVEALACGTPIVISDAGGARELIDRPEAGRIAARDPAAISEAIRSILANPPSPDKVRETATRFTWKANGDLLRQHLQSMVDQRPREGHLPRILIEDADS